MDNPETLGHIRHMTKTKKTNTHTQKRSATPTPPKTGGELRCANIFVRISPEVKKTKNKKKTEKKQQQQKR